MNNAIAWAKSFWGGLPKHIQAGIVVLTGAAITSVAKAASEQAVPCFQWVCLKHYVGIAVSSGFAAGYAFFMRPGPGRDGGPNWEGGEPTTHDAKADETKQRS